MSAECALESYLAVRADQCAQGVVGLDHLEVGPCQGRIGTRQVCQCILRCWQAREARPHSLCMGAGSANETSSHEGRIEQPQAHPRSQPTAGGHRTLATLLLAHLSGRSHFARFSPSILTHYSRSSKGRVSEPRSTCSSDRLIAGLNAKSCSPASMSKSQPSRSRAMRPASASKEDWVRRRL